MKSAWSHDENGRFQVKLPWKLNPKTLDNNKEQAVNRDLQLRKQLSKNAMIYDLFQEQIKEMIKNGIIYKADPEYPKRYLPLLDVINFNKDSSKVRICLDTKSKFKGISLNDALLKGRLEMADIFQALTRFRCGIYAILGDIKKMFWQIRLSEEDAQYHGIIWEGQTYVFTRVCFGDKPSPPIANQSMMKIAAIGEESYPHGSEMIREKQYVDDILDASSSMEMII